ncbi:MAG: hydrogenase 4 subunit B [Alphaproteobacteria bacterium]|nr:hydrogenase 4 subunit B [Alphaproteobacteria bacterium]
MTMAVVPELACVGALLALGVLAVALARFAFASRLVYGLSFLVTFTAFVVALLAIPAPASDVVLPLGLPWMGAHFRVDALSAFFLVVVNFGAAAASFYAIGYGSHEEEPARVLPFYPAFVAGMNLVVMAGDAFAFLLSWEFMSLTSWALVMSHHKDAENRRAGYVYLLMATFGTLCLLLAFGLLAGADGGYVFVAMRGHQLSATLAALVLMLTLLGAGSKAGLFPLHVWLPMAHPAAPSHVSALMSGVMTKVAVYAFIRIVFDLVGFPDWWWSVVVLVLGGVTAVMGVLYALMQCDLKRLLAYSTVENIGIIFIGLGLALAFRANHMDGAAALALTGALLHVLNHAVFKSLLFFGAGAVLNATGLKDIEKLGGLIHRMRITSTAFLVGSVAISALPPFNGFVSEWLTFQAVLLSPQIPQWGLKLMVPTAGTMLALAAALAGACFVRGFGVSFLGRPRSAAATNAHEVDRFSLAAMAALALLCLLLGILPAFAIDGLAPVVQSLVHAQMPRQLGVAWWTVVPIASSRSSYNGLLVFLFIAFSATTAALVIHTLASRVVRRGPAWDCGTPSASTATQYTAGSFAQPIRRVFGSVVFRAREAVTMPAPGDGRPAVLNVSMTDLPWDVIYDPIRDAVNAATGWLNRLQFMTIRRYLTLVFMTLILLLLVLAIW